MRPSSPPGLGRSSSGAHGVEAVGGSRQANEGRCEMRLPRHSIYFCYPRAGWRAYRGGGGLAGGRLSNIIPEARRYTAKGRSGAKGQSRETPSRQTGAAVPRRPDDQPSLKRVLCRRTFLRAFSTLLSTISRSKVLAGKK